MWSEDAKQSQLVSIVLFVSSYCTISFISFNKTLFRPAGLVSNWLAEVNKWFDEKTLRLRLLSENNWVNDKKMTTIWMIKDSQTTDIERLLMTHTVGIAVLFCDEWHIYSRSGSGDNISLCLGRILKFVEKAEFVCQMSGSLFPLGPKSHGEKVLLHLGGSWEGNSCEWSKWTDSQVSVLQRLFEKCGGRRLR